MKNLILVFFVLFNFVFCAKPLKIYTDEWFPYEYNLRGKVSGFSTEVVVGVLNSMKVNYEDPFITSWARGLLYLRNGSGDMLYSGIYTEERAKLYHYPDETIIDSKWVLFVKKSRLEELKFNSFYELKDKRFGVVSSYSYHDDFWNFLEKNQNYETVSSDEVNFRKLMAERLDYVCIEVAVGLSKLKQLGLKDDIVPIVETPVSSAPIFCFFSKKTVSEEFVDEFSNNLKKFKTTEEYQKIYNKYF